MYRPLFTKRGGSPWQRPPPPTETSRKEHGTRAGLELETEIPPRRNMGPSSQTGIDTIQPPPPPVDRHTPVNILYCPKLRLQVVTRMHSSRMRTARSNSHLLGGVCLSACWYIPQCGPGDPPPRPDPSTSPLGVGLETRKACWDTTPQRPATHAGIPPPLWTEFLTHTSENIILPQTSFAGGNYPLLHSLVLLPVRVLLCFMHWGPINLILSKKVASSLHSRFYIHI